MAGRLLPPLHTRVLRGQVDHPRPHPDLDHARQILSAAPLPAEITRFTAMLLQQGPDQAALAILDTFAQVVTGSCLASNAITLLSAARGGVPELRRG